MSIFRSVFIRKFRIIPILFLLALMTQPSKSTEGAKPLQITQVASQIASGNYAIIIGINDYESNDIIDLKYCEADALAMYDVLVKACDYDPEHVYLYLDGKSDPSYAKKAEGQVLIKRFYSLCEPSYYKGADTILVYYSGHGANMKGMNYIIPVDGTCDEALAFKYNINLEGDIFPKLKESNFKRQVVYIDACRNVLSQVKGVTRPFVGIKEAFKYGTGLHVLMSTKEGQYSKEVPELGHGIFTYYLLKGLGGEAADDNNLVTVGYVHDYVFEKMAKFSEKNLENEQMPIAMGEGNYTIPLAIISGSYKPSLSSTPPSVKPSESASAPLQEKPAQPAAPPKPKEESRWLNGLRLELTGGDKYLQYDLSTETIDIEIYGLPEKVNAISTRNIKATLNVSAYGKGNHNISPTQIQYSGLTNGVVLKSIRQSSINIRAYSATETEEYRVYMQNRKKLYTYTCSVEECEITLEGSKKGLENNVILYAEVDCSNLGEGTHDVKIRIKWHRFDDDYPVKVKSISPKEAEVVVKNLIKEALK